MPENFASKTETPSLFLEPADIEWREGNQPYSRQYGDVYHSSYGSLAESEHVFIHAAALARRWEQAASGGEPRFTIGELGFGGGLNFLLCCRLWQQTEQRPPRLHYLGFEKHPLPADALARLLGGFGKPDGGLAATLLRSYPEPCKGVHRLHFGGGIVLDLHFGDALAMLSQREQRRWNAVNAWFMDGFAPRRNPDMWSLSLLQLLARQSGRQTTLSTYSVAGQLRRDLRQAGFAVEKRPGFAGKREMLFATIETTNTGLASQASKKSTAQAKHAVIVGAGLAGCSTAWHLANRGWRVTILEQSDCIAADASGNDQAVLQCRLYRQADPPALLYLHAYLYAARQYHRLSRKMNFAWQNCGVLLLAEALNRKVRIEPALFEQVYSPRIARAMSAEAASALAGVSLAFPALFMPHGGWLNPRALCSAYVSHHDISVVNSCRVSRITQQSGVRVVHAAEQKYSADAVVIANSHQAVELEQTEFLPLQQLPGQVTTVQANDFSRKIRSVICGARYILPECNGNHTLGASYRLDAQDLARHKQEDVENLNRVREVMVTPEGLPAAVTAARVSSRCGSLDHLPSVGRLPGSASVGVYVNVAHGSLGLATTPLAAEYLASLLNDEDPPLDRVCESLLSPDRFIKRSGHPKRRIKPQCSAKSKRSKTYGTSG